MEENEKLLDFLYKNNLEPYYRTVERLIDTFEDFCAKEEVSEDVKKMITEAMSPIIKAYEEVEEYSQNDTKINDIELKILAIELNKALEIQRLIEEELERINNKKEEEKIIKIKNERKLVDFLKEKISEFIKNKDEIIQNLDEENEKLQIENISLGQDKKKLEEKREELENEPLICALVKKENPFKRFMRIMRENPYAWTEEEVDDKIVLLSSDGEIRAEIPKEIEDKREEIVKTEKTVGEVKAHYGLFKRLKNLRKPRILNKYPRQKENELGMNFLEIETCRGKIEDNSKRINYNLKKKDDIIKVTKEFESNVEKILNDSKTENIDSMMTVAELIRELEKAEEFVKNYACQFEFDTEEDKEYKELEQIVNMPKKFGEGNKTGISSSSIGEEER